MPASSTASDTASPTTAPTPSAAVTPPSGTEQPRPAGTPLNDTTQGTKRAFDFVVTGADGHAVLTTKKPRKVRSDCGKARGPRKQKAAVAS